MIRAYGIRIALFALGGLLLGIGLSLFMKPRYEGIMQVLVDQRPIQNARMMSRAEESVSDLLEAPRARTVATQVEQLTGFGVLLKASEAVHQERGLPFGSIEELQLMNLQRSLSVEAATESDIITLRVRMPEKQLAQDVLSNIYLAFDQQNQENSRQVGAQALAFLDTQTAAVKQELNKVDAALMAMRQQYNAPNVDLQVQSEIQSLKTMEDAYNQARIEHASAVANAALLRSQLKSIPPYIESSQSTGVNAVYQKLESELASAKTERAMLLTQWKEGSVMLKPADQKVAYLEGELRKAKAEIPVGRQRSVNPLYQTLAGELARAESQAAAAGQKVGASSAVLQQKSGVLVSLPEAQRKIMDLERQQSALTQTYLQYKDSLESLKVSQRGRMTASTLVSPPFVNPDPVSPNMPLNLAAGLLAGCLLGVLSAFASESRKSPIRNLTHLNRLAFEPSFRTIPELPLATPSLGRQPDDAYVALLGSFVRSGTRPYRLGVVGVEPNAGSSTTAACLAAAASIEEHKTLLIDTGNGNGAASKLGIADGAAVAAGDHLTAMRVPLDQLASTTETVQQIRAEEATCELSIIDLQPFKNGTNPLPFVSELDECILLVRAGQTRSVDFLQAQQMLADAGVQQVTVVLSRTRGLDDDFSFAEPTPPALAAR